MSWSTVLRIGLRLLHDGEVFTIVELSGRRILLAAPSGELRQVDCAWLLCHPSTRILEEVGSAEGDPPPESRAYLSGLTAEETDALTERVEHVQEVLTGFRFGSAELAQQGEPRPDYSVGVRRMARYRAKAAELGVSVSTVRRMVTGFEAAGPEGLLPSPRERNAFASIDPRWTDMAQRVIAEHVEASQPTHQIVLLRVEERLAADYGRGTVPIPGKTKAYELLGELTRGTNTFRGSAKGKRSIANRPTGLYGRLRATRPGEYVLLDTTRLDVYAMEPVSCRWVQVELTAAMDLHTRCITGLRVTPVSTKAVDVAGVLYETVRPFPEPRELPSPRDEVAPLPFHGVPDTVVLPADKLVDHRDRRLLPSVAAETIVYDHGKIYLSHHVASACQRLQISRQPARPATPTDKSPLERWFRTLSQGLLVALPGYKGPDVHSRGLDVESQAFFFLDELELIVREWIERIYHVRPHSGLSIPEIPGLKVSPLEMLEHGINRVGHLRILNRPDLAYDFLKIHWTSIQHYGVEINTLRYNGPGLRGLANRDSPYQGAHAGKWPFAIDEDIRYIYFQRPDDGAWHRLDWEHAADLGRPLTGEITAYARRLARATQRFPDTKRALVELLERWDAGLTGNPTERRMAIRLSTERLGVLPDEPAEAAVLGLPSVARLTTLQQNPMPTTAATSVAAELLDEPTGGDDDDEDECDADLTADRSAMSDEEYYRDALETS